MSDPKRAYTDGTKQFVITDKQAAELNKGRPTYLPPITPVKDGVKIRSNFRNAEGEMVDQRIDSEQVRQRAVMGENVVADKASIEQARQEGQVRTRRAMADEEDVTTLLNAALPGAQWMQDKAVGRDAAAEARQELNQENMAASLVGNLAELAIGGKIVSMGAKGLLGAERAGKLGVKLGLSKDSTKLSKVGRVLAEEPIADTHFYIQNMLDTNGEFEAEVWAGQIGTGLVFGAPFAIGAASRGIGQKLRGVADKVTNGNALGTARTVFQAGAVAAPAGSKIAQSRARAAGFLSITNKLFRRKRAGAALSASDEALLAARQVDDDMLHANRNFAPEKLDNMRPSARVKAVEEFKRYADGDVSFLDGLKYGTIVPRVKQMSKQVAQIRQSTLLMHKKLHGNLITDFKIPNTVRDDMIRQSNEVLKYADDVGMADVKAAIKRGFTGTDDAATMHKALFEAKVNARFRRGVSPGATEVDEMLTKFLEDPKLWRGQAKKNASMNRALEDVVQVWDDLGDVHIPKHLEAIDIGDGMALGKNQASIEKLTRSLDTLQDAGLITDAQRADLNTRMIGAGDAVKKGTEAYGDVIKINRARNAALGKLKKQRDTFADIPTSPESFAATKAAAAMETAKDVGMWTAKGLDAFLSTKPMAYGNRGVGALHGMSVQEKYEVFEHVQREMVNLAGNPAYLTEALGNQLDRGAEHDPIGTDFAGQKTVNTIMYLQSQLPPQDDTVFGRGVPQPLSAIEEYLEKWVSAYDPVSVGYEVYKGTITPQMVDSLRVTNPKLYSTMQVDLAETMSRVPAEKANPSVLAAANIFLGGMDPLYTGDFIAKIQSNYSQTVGQDQVINGGHGAQGSIKNPGAEQGLTTSQRQQSY